jgi:branched-chain amino acid transport system ATP-binding protein
MSLSAPPESQVLHDSHADHESSERSDLLDIRDVSFSFGGVKAVANCSFTLRSGVIGALIGPNGAGKTTLVNMIGGALKPDDGKILFNGSDITGWPCHRIAQQRLIRTFQLSREFAGLTVLENLLIVAPNQAGERLFNVLFRPRIGKRQDASNVQKALALLNTFSLHHLRNEYASNLSSGQKRLLELARGVMAEPELLVLDEPAAGVNPALMEQLVEHIRAGRDSGITFLLVEHNLQLVEELCDHVIVMAEGGVMATGLMADLRKNAAVARAYMGGGIDERATG